MLNPAFDKKFLFGTTVFAGFAALTVMSAPAQAQTGTQTAPAPGTSSEASAAIQQQSPNQGAPDVVAPDPAVIEQPSPEEARNQSGEPVSDDEEGLEAVVVTGSRIRRDPINAPQPLIQVNREQILQSGEPNIIDFLADIPALQSSQVPEDTTGASLGAGGLSLLNLRNLGAVRTLVLVDGRRHVGGAPGSPAVDIDTIPSLLIENTELITGGASAIYGADAVAGVVNFILRKNFEGIEIDASFGQIAQEGDSYNKRVSGLIGKNLLNDRLNIYAFGEYQQTDEVTNDQLRPFINQTLVQNDLDPNATTPDGVLDVIGFGPEAGSVNRVRGGTLTLARGVAASPLNDPDIPFVTCPAFTAGNRFNANCFVIDPGFAFTFGPTGQARPLNFGTDRVQAGLNRTVVIGGDAFLFSESLVSRLPVSDAKRFQTGFNFDVVEGLEVFGEAKYVQEETTFDFQPAFFDIGIRPFAAGEGTFINASNFTNFEIGTDNAFLDPTLRDRILTNRIQLFTAPTATTPSQPIAGPAGTRLDQRALLRIFANPLGARPQTNTRDTERYVLGLRGDRDQLSFINNISYEVSYQFGAVEDLNEETSTPDVDRFAFGADAVRNAAGQTVCRVQLLAAQGQPLPVVTATIGTPGERRYTASDAAVRECVPFSVFGDPGTNEAVQNYVNVNVERVRRNEQENFLAFASGELFDPFGAGPIGVAAGYEYRKETTSGTTTPFGERTIFSNSSPAFPNSTFDVSEYFAEVRLPIFKDRPFAEDFEISLSGRVSDYSTFGKSDTYGLSVLYRPIRDFALRGTYGVAVRAPTLLDLFRPEVVNFATVTDNCSILVINTTADQRIRDNRIRNCAALGIPANFIDTRVGSAQGRLGGNPNLAPEESQSYTLSGVFTPRFAPRFSLVLDSYDIKITQAIQTLSVQQILNQCTDNDSLNTQACGLLGRDAVTFNINNFLQAPLNFANLRARGIDFNARYSLDLEDLDFINRDIGRLDFSLAGSYIVRRQDFVNPSDPSQATNIDATAGNPRVRYRLGTTYSLARFAVTYNLDYQASQEFITNNNFFLQDVDNRDVDLRESGAFIQHDFSARYDLTDNVRLRAGVTNAFDAEPDLGIIANGPDDIFDLFGRRFFVGLNLRFGAPEGSRR